MCVCVCGFFFCCFFFNCSDDYFFKLIILLIKEGDVQRPGRVYCGLLWRWAACCSRQAAAPSALCNFSFPRPQWLFLCSNTFTWTLKVAGDITSTAAASHFPTRTVLKCTRSVIVGHKMEVYGTLSSSVCRFFSLRFSSEKLSLSVSLFKYDMISPWVLNSGVSILPSSKILFLDSLRV